MRSASCWAAWTTRRVLRLSWAWATEVPDDDGRLRMAVLAPTLTSSGSTPAAFRSATATPWRWSIRALSRWAGSTVGLPAVEAFMAAAERASWLFVVNLASKRDPFVGLVGADSLLLKLSLLRST